MSKNLCSYDSTGSDAIISWESMEWDVHGGEVSNQTIEETKLCHSDGDHTSYGDFLSLRMPPSSWSWSTGYNACKQVGQMYDDFVEADQERRKNGRKVFENLGAYEYVWTSLQYINESKEIINLNSNITSDYRYDQNKMVMMKVSFFFKANSIGQEDFQLIVTQTLYSGLIREHL